ncbi:MAG TPA: TIGR03790 family protein [Candidatus Methylacidiphilales bacterium]|nr:TIGR03790 family protein [Candidatus Methylacidiphilales bacterium]
MTPGRSDDVTSYETDTAGMTNVPSWVGQPEVPSSLAASTFLQTHPELAQPSSPLPNVSLQDGAVSDNNPEQLGSPSSEPTLQPFQFARQSGRPEDLPKHLLVVYNKNDADSRDLADYYASRRDIPAERVLGIDCPLTEEITRAQYETSIRQPILAYLYQNDLIARRSEMVHYGNRILQLLVANYNEIWAIVLMRGVPLKIAQDSDLEDSMEREPELQTNAAAVDSELALLPVFGLPYGGFVPNPFFDADSTGAIRAGPELATKIILVTRLDGPKPSDVRRMIDESIWAEQNRLAGLAVIDSRGFTDVKNGYTSGDTWLRSARSMLADDGWSVKFDDKPETIPASDPCNGVAFYLGWYAENAGGPWITPPGRFMPGAIAYHLHSYSASTVRSETQNWVGPLIAHGADATMGTVYEPYLSLTPHLDIFTKRLLMGQTFAEAAYASEKGLSWMVTVVGDPLYRPFARPIEAGIAKTGARHTPHDDWLFLQLVQRAIAAHRIAPDNATLQRDINIPGAGAVAYEGLGDLLEKLNDPASIAAAEKAYKRALSLYIQPVDVIRVGLKLAQHYTNRAQDEEAQAELKTLRELYPQEAQRFGVASQLLPTASQLPSASGMPSSIPAPQVPQPPRPPGPPQP